MRWAVSASTKRALVRQGIGEGWDLPLFAVTGAPSCPLLDLPAAQSKLLLKDSISPPPLHKTLVLLEAIDADARAAAQVLELESVILGFVRNRQELRSLKQNLIRSNTRGVYVTDTDDWVIAGNVNIQQIANAIERRRVELGKTSGFERMYARVTRLYFGGMYRHLASLRPALKPGAKLAYVVGDQASYLRVMIRTGQILAEIAESLGYVVAGTDLFRTRPSTVTGEHLREEVVLLRWPGY